MKTSLAKIMLFLALALLAAQTPGPASAQLKPGGSGNSRGPIVISSDRMESDDPQGVVHFFGDVVAQQGDMTITCDRMDVIYDRQEKVPDPEAAKEPAPKASGSGGQSDNSPFSGATRQIDRVECHGNVKVWEGERVATGQKALYLAKSLPRRIILTGEARVWQGRDSLTGHQVTYYLDTDRSLAESGQGGRVRTTYSNQEGDKK